jgi:uncharacterized protein (DUF924 family)
MIGGGAKVMNDTATIGELLTYWFGELNEHGVCSPKQSQLWFRYRDSTDDEIRSRFGEWVRRALAGELDHWEQTDEGLMALLLCQDQLTRNIFRGSPAAFSGDARALALAQSAVAAGRDRHLPSIHRVFLYVPYEHAEDLAVQNAGVDLFQDLLECCDDQVRDEIKGYGKYAEAHRDVIERFGRFPHRNDILQRDSTPGELAYLEKHGGF